MAGFRWRGRGEVQATNAGLDWSTHGEMGQGSLRPIGLLFECVRPDLRLGVAWELERFALAFVSTV